ncbi:MAG TPA: PIN domain-containing protein [Thermomicrobiales bacterium]|nr:PIN domain-containing protein [Thermomicrobiales bacterium]
MNATTASDAAHSSFLDSSMIVRYLVGDNPVQSARARSIVETGDRLAITPGTVTEVGYVLSRIYEIVRDEIVDQLVALLQRENIIVHELDTGLVVSALLLCRPSGRVSFADAMLWAAARSAGSGSVVYTFDRRFPSTGIETRS